MHIIHTGHGWYICTCARLHVQLCLLFCISETAGRIALKLGVWLESHGLGVLQKSRVGYINTCKRAAVPPFLYLGNEWADCAETCMVRDPLARRFTKV